MRTILKFDLQIKQFNCIFEKKISKLHKKDTILHTHDNYIFPTTWTNKNKYWAH